MAEKRVWKVPSGVGLGEVWPSLLQHKIHFYLSVLKMTKRKTVIREYK